MEDLSPVCELGSGTCGNVIKMKHNPTGYMMAVKVNYLKFKTNINYAYSF